MILLKVSFDSKGDFDNTIKWLNDVTTRKPNKAIEELGKKGVESLSRNTPKDTGVTALGWDFKMESKDSIIELAWINTAHPTSRVSVARLIELGHGTRNGGYVSPRPYIKQSMETIFKSAGDKLAEEMFK